MGLLNRPKSCTPRDNPAPGCCISVGDEGKAVRIPKFTDYSQKALEFGGNI